MDLDRFPAHRLVPHRDAVRQRREEALAGQVVPAGHEDHRGQLVLCRRDDQPAVQVGLGGGAPTGRQREHASADHQVGAQSPHVGPVEVGSEAADRPTREAQQRAAEAGGEGGGGRVQHSDGRTAGRPCPGVDAARARAAGEDEDEEAVDDFVDEPKEAVGRRDERVEVHVRGGELLHEAGHVAGPGEEMQPNAGVPQPSKGVGAKEVADAGGHGDAHEDRPRPVPLDGRRARLGTDGGRRSAVGHGANRRNHSSVATHCQT